MARSVRSRILIGIVTLLGLTSELYAEGNTKSETAPTLEEVMQRLAKSGGVAARFHESRALVILNEPIESAGMLYFAPPDWLARHVTEPGESMVVVRDDQVIFRDETGVQTLELGSNAVARAMVDNTMVLMRGDLDALNAQYKVTFRVEGNRWTLDLEPRRRVIRKLIEHLRVEGRGGELTRMESTETNGDITVTTFSEVKVGIEFSPEFREEIFSLHPIHHSAEGPSRADLAP